MIELYDAKFNSINKAFKEIQNKILESKTVNEILQDLDVFKYLITFIIFENRPIKNFGLFKHKIKK